MRILAIADVEERCLWDFYSEERFGDVDLILSAGDLCADYLEFLVTVTNKPLLYVRGNHDDAYAKHAPGGCICVEDSVYVWNGLRIAGLGGSMRYRDGLNMYTEREMARRVLRLEPKVRLAGGVDILLAHAPARGVGDLEDLPHRGFECFNGALGRWRPDLMVHGHVHKGYDPSFKRERVLSGGCRVVNACGYALIDVDEKRYPDRGWRGAWLNAQTIRREHASLAASRPVLFDEAYW
ncbi:MAG: metallophosphoesterase family protein [Coriobacteriia bacterium]|nr:metallophosphoesterase family protein [Coriobacteriia bacterium]